MEVHPYDKFGQLKLPELLKQISSESTGPTSGKDAMIILSNFILVRTAEMVNQQLEGTASTIARSANTLKETLELAKTDVIKASDKNIEATQASAEEIRKTITDLTGALASVRSDLQKSGNQSATLARGLNWLTGVIAVAALISAAATAFYAYETKRQVDLMLQQLQSTVQRSPANTNSLPSKQ
jgi:hypothetical protein